MITDNIIHWQSKGRNCCRSDDAEPAVEIRQTEKSFETDRDADKLKRALWGGSESSMNDAIVVSFRLVNAYLRRLVEVLNDAQMVSQPADVPNHPAWTTGHLLHSYQAIGGELGLSAWLPADWGKLFGTGTTPQSDAGMYPSKSRLLELLTDSESRLVDAISAMTASELGATLPDAEYRRTLPTIGHALVHILVGHSSVHVGQLTVWRRAMHLPRVPEAFDRAS